MELTYFKLEHLGQIMFRFNCLSLKFSSNMGGEPTLYPIRYHGLEDMERKYGTVSASRQVNVVEEEDR